MNLLQRFKQLPDLQQLPPAAKRRVADGIWAVARAVLMLGLSFIILYPLLYMISMSLRPVNEMADPSVIWVPKSLTLDSFKRAVVYLNFQSTLPYTAIVTLASTVLQMASAALAGYGMSRTKFKGQKVLFVLLLLTIIVPPQNIVVSLYRQYRNFNFFGLGYLAAPFNGGLPFTVSLIDSPFSMILPAMFASGIRSGLVIYIYMQFFKGLPKELEDAAYVDGCGSFKTFAYIVIPNMAAVLLTVFVFSIVWYWTDFYYASMFSPRFA
ncbi:MAG: carbohydrate ABC transporter permease, partial [Clostridia bacterium]|nr:carbohydrate ABC transporter permease [Clostridia bacterium]